MAEYRFSDSGALRAEFVRLYRIAWQQGRGAQFLSAFKMIRTHLMNDPAAFGEAIFDFKHMKLVNYVAIVPPVSIHYCVDETRKIIYLRRIQLLEAPKQ